MTIRSCGWFWICSIPILSQILYWYGPSVPPSPSQDHNDDMSLSSWGDFWKHQSELVFALVSSWIQVTKYVSFWTWQGIQQDYGVSSSSSFWSSTRESSSSTSYHGITTLNINNNNNIQSLLTKALVPIMTITTMLILLSHQ